MTGYTKFSDFLWIFIVLLFLFPVIRHSGSHTAIDHGPVEQGPLMSGRESLDSLLSDNLGKPVIVNFWATWCTPCVGELPVIDEIFRSMEGRISVVAVDIGDLELETLLKFREETDLSMPVIWLNENDAAKLKDDWELSDVLPITVVFDSEGNESTRAAGVRDADFFRNSVEEGALSDTTSEHHIEELSLHINVVGIETDSLTVMLMTEAVELASGEGVDFYDPSITEDSLLMEELYLPDPGYPYAQPCVGGACGRLVRTPVELRQAVQNLSI
ncbi:MAG: TlpA disulfide reductase family protein [Candidatus Fermentibacteria bacterium]